MKISGLTKIERAESILNQLNVDSTKYSNMTYEQGIEIALQWIIGQVSDDEFESAV